VHADAIEAQIDEKGAMSDYRRRADYGGRMIYVMLALALIGIGVASYDSYVIYNGQQLWCPPPIDGCNTVAYSPYARILGVPIGYFGLAYYLGMLGLAAWLAFEPFSRSLRWAALLEHALGQRLLDLVEQAFRAEYLLRVRVLQQLVNQFLLDCHNIPLSGKYGSDTRNS
jgi:Vitamin K epoxide reductase family